MTVKYIQTIFKSAPTLITAPLIFCVIAILLALPTSILAEENKIEAITGGNFVDLNAGKVIANATILINGERVSAIGTAASIKIPSGAKIIHADGKWLLPGIMDMHVHLGLVLPGTQGAELAHESDAHLVLRMEDNAVKSLYAGTTTVRLVGEKDHTEFPLRDAINRGQINGPRIFSAGEPVIPTGGHDAAYFGHTVTGKTEVTRFVREQIHAGATWIKLFITGGLTDPGGDIQGSDMTEEEMRAAVETAHSHGVRVAAHDGSPVAAMQAINAGVDSFEHGYFFTKEVFEAMKKHDKWYVPTIDVSQAGALEFFKKIGSPPWYLARAKSVGKAHWRALQAAIKVGVNIAMGTDEFPFEPNEGTVASVRETELYVEAGMTPLQALRAAMVNPARMLGDETDLGALAPGKYADIVAVSSNPLDDIHALRTIGFVMKGGDIIRDDWGMAQ